MFNFNLHSTFF